LAWHIRAIAYMLSRVKNQFESSSGLSDECRKGPGAATLWTKPNDLTLWTIWIKSYSVHMLHRHWLLINLKADTQFTVPWRVKGWVDLGGWYYISRWCTCPQTVTRVLNEMWHKTSTYQHYCCYQLAAEWRLPLTVSPEFVQSRTLHSLLKTCTQTFKHTHRHTYTLGMWQSQLKSISIGFGFYGSNPFEFVTRSKLVDLKLTYTSRIMT